MKEKIKKHGCKILLAILQITFLGAGPVYIKEFANLVNEMQQIKREVLVQVNQLQKTGENIEDTGKALNSSVKSIEKELKKVKKACERIRF